MSIARDLAESVAQGLDFLPAPLVIVLVAALPVLELRGSIPLAHFYYEMGWAEAFTWSLVGNLGIVPVVWFILPHAEKLVRHVGWIDRTLDWLFERTRRKAGPRVEKYEELALVAFVAIPLPGTGAWTGILVAYLFGLTWKKSWPYLYTGVVLASFIVILLVYGTSAVF